MKKFKRLTAIVLAVAMVCSFATISFADVLDSRDNANYEVFSVPATITQGETEFTVGIGIKDKTGATIDIKADASLAFSNLYLTLADDAKSAGIEATAITTSVGTKKEGYDVIGTSFGTQVLFNTSNVSLDATTSIMDVTFSIPADVAVGTYKIAAFDAANWDQGDASDASGDTGALSWGAIDLVTVTAAGGNVEVPEATEAALTAGVAGKGGETYDNAAMATVTFTNIADITKVGVLFIPTAILNGAALELNTVDVANAEYAGALNALGEGSYTLKAALRGIPRKYYEGINITSRAYAIYGDAEVKYADAKAGEITFAATAE